MELNARPRDVAGELAEQYDLDKEHIAAKIYQWIRKRKLRSGYKEGDKKKWVNREQVVALFEQSKQGRRGSKKARKSIAQRAVGGTILTWDMGGDSNEHNALEMAAVQQSDESSVDCLRLNDKPITFLTGSLEEKLDTGRVSIEDPLTVLRLVMRAYEACGRKDYAYLIQNTLKIISGEAD